MRETEDGEREQPIKRYGVGANGIEAFVAEGQWCDAIGDIQKIGDVHHKEKNQDIAQFHDVGLLFSAGNAQVDRGKDTKREEVDSNAEGC